MASQVQICDKPVGAQNLIADAYLKLGGMRGVAAVVKRFYREMSHDPILHPLFHGNDLNWLAARQAQFVAQALGAPISYKGPSMKSAHSILGIGIRHKRMVELFLSQTLAEAGLLPSAIAMIVALVEPV
jgi:hemoglobin